MKMRTREVLRGKYQTTKNTQGILEKWEFTQYHYHKIKMKDIGIPYIFLGYAQNHTGSTYLMLNIRTKRIVLSRDTI